MQNIDYHLIGYIAEYLKSHEQICFKFINKNTCKIFQLLNFKIQEPSFKNRIPLNIVYWLVDNLKLSKNFQSSCCTRLCFEKDYYKLYDCLEDKNYCYSNSFLGQCLSNDVVDIIINCIMSKKYMFDFTTIYIAARKNNKRVLKWCLKNKKLCTSFYDNIIYDLIQFVCKTDIDNISSVKYLLENGFKITPICLEECIIHNNFIIFQYLINNVKYDLSINFTPTELMNTAIQYERLNFMKYIKEIYDVRITDISFIYDLVRKYKKTMKIHTRDCIEWLIDNGKYIFQEDIEIQLIYLGFNV